MDTSQAPRFTGLANYRKTPGKTQRVRVLRADWFGPDGVPVRVKQEFVADASDAQTWLARGMVEFVRG